MNVRKNLAIALRHLRAIGYVEKPWWIDAICINQGDSTEKGHQVRIMADIYRKADEVLAWLGFKVSNEELAKATAPSAAGDMLRQYGKESLTGIMDSRWWTRRWIIQEAILAKKLTFLNRTGFFSWDDVRAAMEKKRKQAPRKELRNIYRVYPLYNLRSIFENISSGAAGVTITMALAECRGIYRASERVDYVYALLGIVIDGDWIIPDYGQTLQNISTDIIAANLSDKNSTASSIEFLSHCGSPEEDSDNEGESGEDSEDESGEDSEGESGEDSKGESNNWHLSRSHHPTWVPFWDHSTARTNMDNCQALSTEAFCALHTAHKPFIEENGKILNIQGVILDRVQEVSRGKSKKRVTSGIDLVLDSICHDETRIGDTICWIYFRQSLILRKHGDGWLLIGTGAVISLKGSAEEYYRVITTLPLQDFRIY